MDKYFLIKNEPQSEDNEFKGNIFTTKEIGDDKKNFEYTLISKNTLHKLLNAEMQRIEDELYDLRKSSNVRGLIRGPREKELLERIEIVIERYNELMKNNDASKYNGKKIKSLNVFLSSLKDPEFLETNKKFLNNTDLTVILNESEMNTIYRGQNIVTLEETLRGKFEDQKFTQRRREYKDENATIEKYNLISGNYLKDIQKQITPKSMVVKESFDSLNEYTLDELDIANKKIEEVAKVINSNKNLSPYEKFYLAFMYVAKYEYKEYKKENKEVSRNLLDIMNSDYIVCAGKANLLKAICDRIGIPCIHRGAELHAICTFGLNDPKYNIYGIQTVDPTNQDFPELYNEENEFPKNAFCSNMNWISALTYRQKDHLIEESGLFYVPDEVKKESAEQFRKIDENLYFINRKKEFQTYKYFGESIKEEFMKLVNKGNAVKKSYDRKMDVLFRWLEVADFLTKVLDTNNLLTKDVIRETEVVSVARDFCEQLILHEEAMSNMYTNQEEFIKDCKFFNIEPTEEALAQKIKEFEKTVIPTVTKIINILKDYAIDFDKNMDAEIKICDEKITDPTQKNKFIPVDIEVVKIERKLDALRENHLANKLGTELGE